MHIVDSRIITDKHDQTVFFPWRTRGKGYILISPKIRRRIEIFLLGFILVSAFLIILLPILLLLLGNFWICTGILFVVLINWLVVYFLIVEMIIKSLPAHPLSYKEIILENLEDEYEEAPET